MDNPAPIPLEELPPIIVDLEDTKPLPKPVKPKYDPDVSIKFSHGKNGVIVAKLVGDGELRIVPDDFKLSLVYPMQIKSSLWNTWSKK